MRLHRFIRGEVVRATTEMRDKAGFFTPGRTLVLPGTHGTVVKDQGFLSGPSVRFDTGVTIENVAVDKIELAVPARL